MLDPATRAILDRRRFTRRSSVPATVPSPSLGSNPGTTDPDHTNIAPIHAPTTTKITGTFHSQLRIASA